MEKIKFVKPLITNPARYWVGVGMISIEVLVIIGIIISFIDWSWVTIPIILGVGSILAFILYNGIAYLLMWSGSRKK